MNTEQIGEIIDDTKQCDPKTLECETIRYIDIASVDRASKRITSVQTIAASEAPSRARKLVKRNDVIVSTVRPNLNAVALVPHSLDAEIASTGFCVLRAKEKYLNPLYLFYFCQSAQFISRLVRLAVGASYPAVTDNNIFESYIPLPSVGEQKRIAAILENADKLRRQRRYAQELSNSFLQSVFLRFFGDLLKEERWKFDYLSSVADVVSGVAKGQKYNAQETVMVPYLRVANVQDGYLDLSEIKYIEALPSDVEFLKLQEGDVLMTEGGDFDKLGRGAIWHNQVENCIHQNHIFRVRLDRKQALPRFFSAYLLTPFVKAYFLKCAKQTTNLASINMSQLKALPVPLPPLELQEQFINVVDKIEQLQSQQREASRQAEHLFETLLHRAFRGEL